MSTAIENPQPHFGRRRRFGPISSSYQRAKPWYLTDNGPVVTMGGPLASGTVDLPPFDGQALIAQLRTRIDFARKRRCRVDWSPSELAEQGYFQMSRALRD